MTLEERLATFLDAKQQIHDIAYVSPHAVLIGDVRLRQKTSVWPMAVLRGDINYIEIGDESNVQDGVVIHVADDFPTIIGKKVTIGHKAVVHACTVEDGCLIGISSTILDGAVIGAGSIIGAGAVVTQRMIVPPRSLVLGVPAKVVRPLNEKELEHTWRGDKYVELAAEYVKRSKK